MSGKPVMALTAPGRLPPSISRYDLTGHPLRQQIEWEQALTRFLEQGGLLSASGAGIANVAAQKVDMNAPGDTPLAVPLPRGITKYTLANLYVLNASVSLSAARAGLYTAPAQGGLLIGQTALSPLTGAAAGAVGSSMRLTWANAATAFLEAPVLYFNVGTVQGAAATADVVLQVMPLSP